MERSNVQGRERMLEARYMALIESHDDLVTRFTPDGILTFVSRSYCALFGAEASELIGASIYRLMTNDEDVETVQARLEQVVASGELVRGENIVRSASGELRNISWVNAGIADDQGNLVEIQSVGRDLTDFRLLEHVVGHDWLTGLPNLTLFKDRLDTALRSAARTATNVTVLFVDLDNFKFVNDIYGHHCGDQMLRDSADVICGCVRTADTVGRYGGDEFTVMLVGAGRSGASKVAESITSGIHAIRIDGVAEPVLGASVGIATYPNDGETCDELLVRADEDMYRVKHKLRRTQTPKRLTTLKPVGGEERSSANNPVEEEKRRRPAPRQ